MTYCVGMRPKAGLVIISDTRTNAGIDNISIYNKLHMLADDGERLIVCASAGSLSVTQSMLSMLQEGLPALDDESPRRTVAVQSTMFRVAQLVGEALSIDGQRITSGDGASIRCLHDEAAGLPHLPFKLTDGVGDIRAAKAVRGASRGLRRRHLRRSAGP